MEGFFYSNLCFVVFLVYFIFLGGVGKGFRFFVYFVEGWGVFLGDGLWGLKVGQLRNILRLIEVLFDGKSVTRGCPNHP
jgi:hypothetical protein